MNIELMAYISAANRLWVQADILRTILMHVMKEPKSSYWIEEAYAAIGRYQHLDGDFMEFLEDEMAKIEEEQAA